MTSEFHFDSRMTMSYTTRDIPDDCSWNDNYRGTDCNRGARCSNLLPKSGKEDVLSSLDEPVRFQKRGWSCSVLQSTSLLSSRFREREREREYIFVFLPPRSTPPKKLDFCSTLPILRNVKRTATMTFYTRSEIMPSIYTFRIVYIVC
jgi:hypothetical protein